MLYRAPGNVLDWMYKRAGIKYSYVLHLRDTGTVRLRSASISFSYCRLYSMASHCHRAGSDLLVRKQGT